MFLSQSGADARGPADDFWYTPIFRRGAAMVSSDTIIRLSTAWTCGKILAETLGQVPCILYRRLERGKERATDHPLYRLIHDQPNEWQTAFEWKAMQQWHLAFRGNAYSEIVASRSTGRIEQLIPLHPDRVKTERAPSGRPRWRVKQADGSERILVQGEMLHLKGLTVDGLVGVNPVEAQRESLGEAMSAQGYSTRTLDNDARPGGVIEWEGHFKDDEDARKFRASWQEAQTGVNRGKTAVLQRGMTFKDIGLKPADLQFMELRKMKREEICGIWRIPPHKAGILERSTNNNIEHQAIEFVTDTMMPWFVNWEQTLTAALIDLDAEPELFFQFLAEALMRGDAKARSEVYREGIQDGWLVRNEVRERENLNPLPGLDKPLEPLNMRGAGSTANDSAGGRDRSAERNTDRLQALTDAAIERVARKETEMARRAWSAADPAAALHAAYAVHALFVAKVLQISPAVAQAYCAAAEAFALGAKDLSPEDFEAAVIVALNSLVHNPPPKDPS